MALLVNTHYKIPWIIWKAELSFEVPGYDYARKTIPHSLPFTPLLLGQWSLSQDFNPSYDISIDIPGGASGGQPPYSFLIGADGTNINITADNNGSATARTFYVRLMAFAPPSYNGDVSPVKYSSNFTYNSHYNYQKIFMTGQASAGEVVTHNLGYIPQARVWIITGDGEVSPYEGIIDENTLKMDMNNGYYYHIYKDAM